MCRQKGSKAITNSYDSTAVLEGLMRIADKPSILSVKEVPVSLWLRSDPDESTDEDNCGTVVRICAQGQDINDTANTRDRDSASHPVHLELSTADDEPPLLDLSIFGTPTDVSDEDIIQGWNTENFAYADIGKVTEFGRFEQQLPRSTAISGGKKCHVYLYVEVSRLSVELYAIFAHDGRAIKPLEKIPFDRALQNGELTTRWKKYQSVNLGVVRLRQVARPESLFTNHREPSAPESHHPETTSRGESLGSGSQQPEGTNSRHPSVSRSKQIEATDSDTSPSNSSTVQLNDAHVGRRSRKRTSSLPKSKKVKRRTMSSLAATKRKIVSDKVQSDAHCTEDREIESEMEM